MATTSPIRAMSLVRKMTCAQGAVIIAALAILAPASAADYSRPSLVPPAIQLGRGEVIAEAKAPAAAPRRQDGSVFLAALEIPQLNAIVLDALRSNPEIQAMRQEQLAARNRIGPAGALDDPMLEAGIVNIPADNLRINREEMTMRMIGIAQRFPYPGKRSLREMVATKEAEGLAHNFWETAARVVRDVKGIYLDLALVREMRLAVEQNQAILERFLRVAESKYRVGATGLADVLKAQTQLTRMVDELIRLDREERTIVAELNRARGRATSDGVPASELPILPRSQLDFDELRRIALRDRPQLAAVRSAATRAEKTLELARKDFYPDFDVRFSYGQRDNAPDGMRRSDMVSLTVAINLPVWRESKREPKLAEAQAMRAQAGAQLQALENELVAKLHQQIAIVEQSERSAALYLNDLQLQATLSVEAAVIAYETNRGDFSSLLENQMTVYTIAVNYASALAAHAKALTEIEFLTGRIVANPPEFLRLIGDKP